MSYTGSQVKSSIRSTREELESKVSTLEKELSKQESAIERYSSAREKALATLADQWLGEQAKGVAADLGATTKRVNTLFAEKAKRRAVLEQQLEELRNAAAEIEAKVEVDNTKIAAAKERLDRAGAAVEEQLKELGAYQVTLREKVALEAEHESRCEQALTQQQEWRSKARAFENNEIFVYLHHVYGNEPDSPPATTWHSLPIVRSIEKWLMRVSHYRENLNTYRLLQELPERAHAKIGAIAKEIAAKAKTLSELSLGVRAAHGITGLEESLKLAESTKESHLGRLKANQRAQAKLRDEKDALDTTKDPFIKAAKEELKSFFGSQTVEQLRKRATSTGVATDDAAVQALQKAEEQINEGRCHAKDLISKRRALDEQLTKMQELERHFSRRGFDDSDSRFNSSLDINSLLLGYMAGRLTETSVIGSLNNSHYEVERPSYSSSSSYSSSDSSSSWSSSSSDSYSSGGGFDGGSGGGDSGGGF